MAQTHQHHVIKKKKKSHRNPPQRRDLLPALLLISIYRFPTQILLSGDVSVCHIYESNPQEADVRARATHTCKV